MSPSVDPRPAEAPVLRPRTIGALGRPAPLPPAETLIDPMWGPPSSQVPAVPSGVAVLEGPHRPDDPDPDLWTVEEPAATSAAGATDRAPAGGRLLRANLLVASGTAASRLTGLIRTSLILIILGQGLNDAYINANNTPNMIYELILGGILTASLVPLFTDDLERRDGTDGTSAIISFALVGLVVVTLLGLVGGPAIIWLLSTGSDAAARDDYLEAGVVLAVLFAPQIFFYGLMAVWSALLNAHDRFMAAAWTPVLNNLVAIATLVVAGSLVAGNPTLDDALGDRQILWVLGGGTTLGIVLMAVALYPAVRRTGFRLRFRFQPRHPAVRRAVALSGWTFGYVVANQVAVMAIQILAEPGSGGPTRYQTAFQWFQLPHALLAVSIMVTFQPMLGRADARGDRAAFNEHLLLGFRLIGLLIIPAAVGYIALPTALEARTFEATGELAKVLDVTGIIAAFAVGLPGFSTYLYALRGFYAMKDTKTPFLVNVLENVLNIALAVAFTRWWGVVGLALAFAVAYNVAAVVAVLVLRRRSPGLAVGALAATWLRLLLGAGLMGGFVYGVVTLMAPSSPAALIPAVAAGIGVGAVTYVAAIYVLRVPGVGELMARLPVVRRFA